MFSQHKKLCNHFNFAYFCQKLHFATFYQFHCFEKIGKDIIGKIKTRILVSFSFLHFNFVVVLAHFLQHFKNLAIFRNRVRNQKIFMQLKVVLPLVGLEFLWNPFCLYYFYEIAIIQFIFYLWAFRTSDYSSDIF